MIRACAQWRYRSNVPSTPQELKLRRARAYCDRRWIGWAWQPDGYSCTAVAICRLATLVNPCWVGCFAIPC
eukprot:scaffold105327_cov69-Phaeocystis_antarctica.AAC.9